MVNKKLNKKGVFGLTAVQSFFVVMLGLALLAYVIIIVMGVLTESPILSVVDYTSVNESVAKPTTAGVTLATGGLTRATCGTVTAIYNGTGGISIGLGNITQTGCLIKNATVTTNYSTTWLFSYPYTASSSDQQNLDSILTNTSTGITSFFGAINPIYAILAVLVIILVLVVLVRVVQNPKSNSQQL